MKWVRVKSEEKEGGNGGIAMKQLEKGNDLLDQICKKNREFFEKCPSVVYKFIF